MIDTDSDNRLVDVFDGDVDQHRYGYVIVSLIDVPTYTLRALATIVVIDDWL